MRISKFKISVSDNEITDLNNRILNARWPDELNNNKWALGTRLSFLQELADYWKNNFDWRVHEKRLNDAGSFKYETSSGIQLHFLHSKSKKQDAIPLLMTHGQEVFKNS